MAGRIPELGGARAHVRLLFLRVGGGQARQRLPPRENRRLVQEKPDENPTAPVLRVPSACGVLRMGREKCARVHLRGADICHGANFFNPKKKSNFFNPKKRSSDDNEKPAEICFCQK